MAENTPNDPDQGTAHDAEAAPRNLHNVLVLALVDGRLSSEEKAHIEALRESLGIDRDEFARLCQQVTEGDKRILLPKTADAEFSVMTRNKLVAGGILVHLGAGVGKLIAEDGGPVRRGIPWSMP